jgi:UDP:flavonoid glycosyltransferase YjiC (YdhE family)
VARIVWAWELGACSGHLNSFVRISRALGARGHAVEHVVRDLVEAEDVLGPGDARLQAPLMLVPPGGLPAAECHADVLMRVGYRNQRAVAGAVRAWLRLFEMLRPDLVVLDHAPTPLIAARIAGIPCVNIGLGFFWPPAVTPMPSLQPWKPSTDGARQERDGRVLSVVNAVLKAHGAPELDSLAALYSGVESLYRTYPELDHYGPRRGARYLGVLAPAAGRPPPPWPEGPWERLFMYYPAGYRAFRPLVDALVELDQPTVVVAAGPGEETAPELSEGRVAVVSDQVDLEAVLAESQLVISHGGHGTVSAALLAGVVPLCVPQEVEQALLGYSVTVH